MSKPNRPDQTPEVPSSDGQDETGNKSAAGKNKKKKFEKNEIGGPKGLEPTRYGDWERKGRAIDF